MTRKLLGFSILMILVGAASASAQPTFTKTFFPDTIGPGSVSTLRFDITNVSGGGVRGLAFSDNLPAGVTLASPASATSSCFGGTLTAADGGSSIEYSGGGLGASSSCSIEVNVTASTPGTYTNTSGDLTSDAGNSGSATDDLTVTIDRPGFSKSFSPNTIGFGGRSTLTFTIDNSANASNLSSLTFTDTFPTGMVIASPTNASTTCGGPAPNLTANAGANVVAFSSFGNTFPGFEVLLAGATCTITVDVVASSAGVLENVSSTLEAGSGGSAQPSGLAVDSLTVTVDRLALSKSFVDDPVGAGDNVTLEFTLTNLDRRSAASNIAFTDDLDAALSGLIATSLPSNPCGAGSAISGTSLLSLSGGSLAAEASCTFSVTLQVPASAPAGSYLNTTSTVSGDVGGQSTSASGASDTLFVSAAPRLTKTFSASTVGSGDPVSVEFTLTNTSASSSATDIAFTDSLDFLSGILVSTLPSAGFCGGGSVISTIFDSTGQPTSIVMAGGNLAASDSCTFTVDFLLPTGTGAGTYVNTTSAVTATVNGEFEQGRTASDSLTVVGAPTMQKEFIDDPVTAGGAVTLQFTITQGEEAGASASDMAFTDDLTAALSGLTAIGLPATGICGAGSEISGTTNLSFTGGNLAAGESCTFNVSLTTPATALPGAYTNTTSNLMATVSGVAVTGDAAQADLQIAGLSFAKSFTDDPMIAGGTVNLEFTINNTSTTVDATNMLFTDSLSTVLSGLAATDTPKSDICGTGSQISGTSFLIFTGGNLLAGESCTFSVAVQVPAGAAEGTYANVTSALSASFSGSTVVVDPASDGLEVASSLLGLSKEFTDDPVAPGGSVTLQFTVDNLISRAVSNLTFSDDLSSVLAGLVSTSGVQADVCGAGSELSGTSLLSLTGGNLPADGSCTFSVTLSVPASAELGTILTNTTSALSGDIGGIAVSGDPASDDLRIDSLLFSKSFDGPTTAGSTAVLTFNLQNPSASTTVGRIGFTDDLDATLSGLSTSDVPQFDVCGSGSMLSGSSNLALTGASLLPGGSCTFSVVVDIPAGTAPGDYLNTTSALSSNGIRAGAAASATLTVEDVPDLPPTVATPVVAPEPSDEGSAATASADFTDPAGAADAPFTCTVDYGDGSGPVAGTVTGFTCTGPAHVYGDNGTFPVTVEVTDKNGLSGSSIAPHQVLNVAPTVATPTVTPEPSDEGSAVTASADFSDPGTDDTPFTCTVDYGDGLGPVAGSVVGNTCNGPAHVYGDNGTFTVTVAVTDKDGDSGSTSSTHQVGNVAPTVATPVVTPEPSDEGSAVSASTTFSDPGSDDSPFTCTVDYGDGSGPVAGSVSGTTCTGPAHTYADNGSYNVVVAVSDKDGGGGSANANHQALNVAPSITASSNSAEDCGATPEGGLVELSVDFTDPGFDNAAAGTFEDFTGSTVDWGDGTVESLTVDETPGGVGTPTTGSVSGSHVYATGGIFTITVTVIDDDGGSDTATLTAQVTGVSLNDGVLQVIGTPGKDDVKIKLKGNQIEVKAKLDGVDTTVKFPIADVMLIEVVTCGDDDKIDVNKKITLPAILDGGDGDDTIKAGDGMSTLIGGPANDKLTGGDDEDLLDGGPGNDDLKGEDGADILLGGDDDDKLKGGQGPDDLDGGPGIDDCQGNAGQDAVINCEPNEDEDGDSDSDSDSDSD